MQPYGALDYFRRRTEGFQRASGKPFGAPAGANPLPRWGLTRRLRRGLGFAVPRGAHTFLSVAKEKCAKESQRHGNSCGPPRCASRASVCGSPFGAVLVLGSLRSPAGKKASIAHFDGGARYVARSGVGQLTHAIVRARSSPFSAVKMGGPFSLRCLSPLCSPAVGVRHTHPLWGDVVSTTGLLCRFNERRLLLPHSRRGAYAALAGLLFSAVGGGQAYPLRGDVVSTTGLLCRFNERRLMIPRSRRGAYAALAGILLPSQ